MVKLFAEGRVSVSELKDMKTQKRKEWNALGKAGAAVWTNGTDPKDIMIIVALCR